jgi:hypothetical protein
MGYITQDYWVFGHCSLSNIGKENKCSEFFPFSGEKVSRCLPPFHLRMEVDLVSEILRSVWHNERCRKSRNTDIMFIYMYFCTLTLLEN